MEENFYCSEETSFNNMAHGLLKAFILYSKHDSEGWVLSLDINIMNKFYM